MNASSRILAHDFLLFYQAQTGISLNKNGDTVRLIDENNSQKDSQGYEGILGYHTAVGRSTDGGGSWAICTEQTPNKPNICPAPTITATPLPTAIPTNTPTPPPTMTPTIPPSPVLATTPTLASTPTAGGTSPDSHGPATSASTLEEKQRTFLGIAGILIALAVLLVAAVGVLYKKRQKKTG